jgi:hypothetical protein
MLVRRVKEKNGIDAIEIARRELTPFHVITVCTGVVRNVEKGRKHADTKTASRESR